MSENDSPRGEDRSPRSAVKGGWILAIIIGLALMGFGGYMYIEHQSQAQGDFEPTEATILTSVVEEQGSAAQDDIHYVPKITYEYTVDGATYQSSNIFPGEGFDQTTATAQSIVNDHPGGAVVTAYYNPDSPSESFLIKSDPPWIRILGLIAVGGLFTVGGIGDLYRRRKN